MTLLAPPAASDLLDAITEAHNQHHAPLTAIRLAAYAADALRVLNALERHALLSPDVARALQSACPSWRNPGGADDPADLIADTLACAVEGLQALFAGLQGAVDAHNAAATATRATRGADTTPLPGA